MLCGRMGVVMSELPDLSAQKPYALDQLAQLKGKIIQLSQSMVLQRARIERCRQSDLAAARDIYAELSRTRETLVVAERCERFRYCCIVGCQNDKRRVETSGGATRVGGTNPGMPQQRSLRKRMVPAARCYNNTPGKFLRHPSFFCGSSNPAK